MKNHVTFFISTAAIFFFLFIACSNNSGTTSNDKKHEKPQSFEYLKTATVKTQNEARVHYNPEIAELINKQLTKEDPQYSGGGPDEQLMLRTKLNKKSDKKYTVVFSMGLSADPHFTFFKGETLIGSMSGLQIFIPGNGNVYIQGHTNNMFNQKKKYVFNGKSFNELKQPFYYVGLETQTTQPINLYQSKQTETSIASLPENAKVEVLLNKGDYYLLRTSFGLAGWIKVENKRNNSIEGLYYAGD